MYRPRPFWYRVQLPEVATQFSGCFSSRRPPNLHLLPSFINQEVGPDGISLTPVAGLHYILHLFDHSEALLALAEADQVQRSETVHEAVRYHDDRLAYLEHDHANLSGRVNHKIAVDAEFSDWVLNKSEEDWISIRGLPRLGSSLSQQEWQVEAKRQVTDVLRLTLQANKTNLNVSVLLVVNPWRRRVTGPTLYNVRLNSPEAARRIREMFSGFFRHANPLKKPASFKGLSLRNKVTQETLVRIAIMRQLGEVYQASNPGSSYKMRGYEPRPLLTIHPSSKASNPRPFTLHFIQAVTTLPPHFSDENLLQIFMNVSEFNRGKLRELFVVLNDDEHDRCIDLVKKHHEDRRRQDQKQDQRSGSRQERSGRPSSASTHVGFALGPGDGMEQESSVIASLQLPRPPPPPESPVDSEVRSRANKSDKSAKTEESNKSGKADNDGRVDTVEESHSKAKKRQRSESASSSSSSERSRDRSRDKSRKSHRPSKSSKSSKSRRSRKSHKSSRKSRRSRSSSSSSSGSGSASGSGSDSSAYSHHPATKSRKK